MKTETKKMDLKTIKPLSRAEQTKVMGGTVSTELDHAVQNVKVFGTTLKEKVTKQ